MKWNVLKEKYFQPPLMFIDSGRNERWRTHAPNTTVRQFCRLKCSLCSHYLLFSLLVLYTNHRTLWAELHTANLDALVFSVNKSPPSEVECSEYFPQLVSRTIHTCAFCSENKKLYGHTMGKLELWLFSNSQDICVWLPNPPTKHDQSCKSGPV